MIRMLIAAALVSGAVAVPAVAQQPDRLSEVYGGWTVECVAADGGRTCIMSQAITAAENNRRVLQAELRLDGGATRLVLLGPFGVLLEAGVVAVVDDKELRTFPFRTCLPAGCLVEVELSSGELESLRRGSQLVLRLKAADSSADVNLNLSLSGVSAALNRLNELAR